MTDPLPANGSAAEYRAHDLLAVAQGLAPRTKPSPFATVAIMVAAPLSVVAVLEATDNVIATFLAYHVGVCLVVPALHTLFVARDGVDGHARRLGLIGARDPVGLGVGVGFGLASFIVLLGAGLVFGDVVLDVDRIAPALEAWGIAGGASAALSLVAYMVFVNPMTEELFWRGWLQSRLGHPHLKEPAIAATGLAFASYHFVVLEALVGGVWLPLAGTAVIFVAALVLAALRELFESVWPPMLAHVGASAGYMAVWWFMVT